MNRQFAALFVVSQCTAAVIVLEYACTFLTALNQQLGNYLIRSNAQETDQ